MTIWDKMIFGLMSLCLIALVGIRIMGKTYVYSRLHSWLLALLGVSFALDVITTLVLGRKKDIDFWLKITAFIIIAFLAIAQVTGLMA
jgi:hypothetical protein